MKDMLMKIISEDNGNPSSMRVIVGAVIFLIVGTWSWHCISAGVLVGFDWEEIGMLLGLLGLKVYQKGKEEASNEG